jgi:hypothetical protein
VSDGHGSRELTLFVQDPVEVLLAKGTWRYTAHPGKRAHRSMLLSKRTQRIRRRKHNLWLRRVLFGAAWHCRTRDHCTPSGSSRNSATPSRTNVAGPARRAHHRLKAQPLPGGSPTRRSELRAQASRRHWRDESGGNADCPDILPPVFPENVRALSRGAASVAASPTVPPRKWHSAAIGI